MVGEERDESRRGSVPPGAIEKVVGKERDESRRGFIPPGAIENVVKEKRDEKGAVQMETEFYRQLKAYRPWNEQEERDQALMLTLMETQPDIFSRENPLAHMTASAWIVNKNRDRILMVYHNLYRSWSWTGGHADGEQDLAAVAVREAMEETGITAPRLVSGDIFSICI